jgi:catechol 2,3-dioxygenase-like lactoylglutathione lyase family enzyme
MKITGLDHVQIAVPPELEEAAIAFYGGTIGLKRLPKPEGTGDTRGAWFDAGNVQLHLGIQEGNFKPATKAHPGLLVEDLNAAMAALEEAGVATKPGSDIPGFKRFFATDPAGNRLEFLQKTN